MVPGMRSAAAAAFVLAAVLSVGRAKLDAETRVAVSNTIQSKAQFEFTLVSTSSDDCDATLSEKECQNNLYYWFAEPQQIESSNDLMLLYNHSSASFNASYVPPSEYTVLGLFINDCALSESDTYGGLYPLLVGDPLKDDVTDAGKTYGVASVESEYMESLRKSSCEYDVSRRANNDDDDSRRANNDDDVSASLASRTVALSLCLATLLFLM